MTGTKRLRMVARVREIEDRIERLVPDIEDPEMKLLVQEAENRIRVVREALQGKEVPL